MSKSDERSDGTAEETSSDEAGVRAAIHLQIRAGDELGLFTTKESDDVTEICGVAECSRWYAKSRRVGVRAVQLQDAIGGVNTGLHRVDGNTTMCNFACDCLQETSDAGTRSVRQDEVRYWLAHCT